jgi:hypothetical protein
MFKWIMTNKKETIFFEHIILKEFYEKYIKSNNKTF